MNIIPKNILFNIIYEDQNILIINKNYNCIVTTNKNYIYNSITNVMIYYYYYIKYLYRNGIVHRLDKDTTGILIIAKDILVQFKLLKLFKKHLVIRKYLTITYGTNRFTGKLNTLITKYKNKSISNNQIGKSAISNIYLIKYIENFLFYMFCLQTGRTHQIRSQLAYLKTPILGDYLYGFKYIKKYKNINVMLLQSICTIFTHPLNKKKIKIYISVSPNILLIKNQIEINNYKHKFYKSFSSSG